MVTFIVWIVFILLEQEPNLNCIKKYVKKRFLSFDFWLITPSEDTKILEFNQYKKSDKEQFIIYAYLECITEKIDGCKNNPENSSTTKVSDILHQVFQYLQYFHLEA